MRLGFFWLQWTYLGVDTKLCHHDRWLYFQILQ